MHSDRRANAAAFVRDGRTDGSSRPKRRVARFFRARRVAVVGAPENEKESKPGLTVVGLGASAGGLQALQEVVSGLPTPLDAAMVVIQHLSPDFETRMDELLAGHTKLPIRRAANEMVLEAGTIYLMPPKVEMIVVGRAALAQRARGGPRLVAADRLLLSLDGGGRGPARGGRGSVGHRKRRLARALCHSRGGGLALVQEPTTARFDGMPRSAMNTGWSTWCCRRRAWATPSPATWSAPGAGRSAPSSPTSSAKVWRACSMCSSARAASTSVCTRGTPSGGGSSAGS